jgi:hypothetical protein
MLADEAGGWGQRLTKRKNRRSQAVIKRRMFSDKYGKIILP